jgi:hypothetical protein
VVGVEGCRHDGRWYRELEIDWREGDDGEVSGTSSMPCAELAGRSFTRDGRRGLEMGKDNNNSMYVEAGRWSLSVPVSVTHDGVFGTTNGRRARNGRNGQCPRA